MDFSIFSTKVCEKSFVDTGKRQRKLSGVQKMTTFLHKQNSITFAPTKLLQLTEPGPNNLQRAIKK